MKEYSRNEERTGVQEAAAFSREFDVQSDFVMVYGFHDLKNRIAKWKSIVVFWRLKRCYAQ